VPAALDCHLMTQTRLLWPSPELARGLRISIVWFGCHSGGASVGMGTLPALPLSV
jgi:hypothetical protein